MTTHRRDCIRVLMCPSGVGQAHVQRLILVARALRERGADVAFAFSTAERLIAAEGFEVFDVPEVEVDGFDRNVLGAYTPDLVDACVDAERAAVEAFGPDVLVSDLRPSVAITATITGVSHVTVVNAYLARQFDPAIALAASGAQARVATTVARAMQGLQKRTAIGAFRQVARRRGIRHLRTLDDLLEGDLTLLADLPEFCPLRGLPSSTRYIGPLIWEGEQPDGRAAGGARLARLGRDRPLIYATTGNTGDRRLVDLALESFAADEGFDVVITTGAFLDVLDTSTPAHVHIERFVPGSAVLGRAIAAIHCGGNGTTYQVLGSGRPAVVLPFTNDQRINAWLIARHGLGLALDPDRTGPAELRAALHGVRQAPTVRANGQRFQALVRQADGPGRAAAAIVELGDARREAVRAR